MRLSIAAASILATAKSRQSSFFHSTTVNSQDRGVWNEARHGQLVQTLRHHPSQAFQHRKASAASKGRRLTNIEHADSALGGICVDKMAHSKARQLQYEDEEMLLLEVLDEYDLSHETCTTITTTRDNETKQFEYCMTYSDDLSCSLEIDGIECSSCTMKEDSFRTSVDCRNTRLGRMDDDFVTLNLEEEAKLYFLYQAMPCSERCNFCDGDALSTNEEVTVTSNVRQNSCVGEYLADLVAGSTDSSFCERMRLLAEEPCECQDPLIPTQDQRIPTLSPTTLPIASTVAGSQAKSFGLSIAAAVASACLLGIQ
ncbi:hypothetical protein IV203_032272 [Nitzschia inconspicua]|uniref:Uncharacterized protein n=1 Tax=Nitzschia inconspicua TaxID=303405 RepID=A0A9K3PF99_9STRA|nr:hypothetical protein IV203_032272 [Nitzschia inconspicua]